eukprot:Phypoly_transcript_23648.p1 GENE.Phypoly_transcript_23648~~Phypoly_transcript_23648.p1  ORF type:complete len:116 (-),score=16.18 Phypoly_transcript_23648:126-473(-)
MPGPNELTPLSSRNSRAPNQPNDGRPKTQQVLAQVEEVQGIMQNNIDVMLQNHEKVSSIEDKTETMKNNASQFKRNATKLKTGMWWKNFKLQLIIALIIIAVLAVIIIPIVLKFT